MTTWLLTVLLTFAVINGGMFCVIHRFEWVKQRHLRRMRGWRLWCIGVILNAHWMIKVEAK